MLPDPLCPLWWVAVELVLEVDVVVDRLADVAEDVCAAVTTAERWACFRAIFLVFVSVSDFGASVTVVVGLLAEAIAASSAAWTGATEVAGASRATTIAALPITPPMPVTAVTRRTRR